MMGSMMAVVKARAERGLEIRQVPIPQLEPGQVLIKTRASSICGTDLHVFNWDPWAANRMHLPTIIGHEFSGDIVEVAPGVTTVKEGDFVSAESHIVCNVCDLCRTGNAHICRNVRIIGIDRDGSFAEYIAIPAENAWVNPPDMSTDIATIQENFGNAVHTALVTPVVARKVLVTGCGPVGLMAIAVAMAAGARAIYATDISEYRLRLAREMGANLAINASRQDAVDAIREATQGEGVDVLLEMSGAPSAIRDGFALLKSGGVAALLGLPSRPLEFDLANLVIMRGITVHGVAGRKMWETWYKMRGLLRSGSVELAPLVTHHYKLADYEQAFDAMASGESGKVILTP